MSTSGQRPAFDELPQRRQVWYANINNSKLGISMMKRPQPIKFGACITLRTLLAITTCVASLCPIGARAAGPDHCHSYSAIYLPRSDLRAQGYSYRLIVHENAGPIGPLDFEKTCVFQIIAHGTQNVLATLSTGYYCPAGTATCEIAVPHQRSKLNKDYVDVVGLDADFGPSSSGAPYALVMPGFADWGWAFTPRLTSQAVSKYLVHPEPLPDLDDQLIWVRAACLDR